MGNQISCDIGSVFIELTIKLTEKPKEYSLTKHFYSKSKKLTYYFLHYKKSKIQEFKNHELFEKIEKNSIPIQVFGINYDGFTERCLKCLSTLLASRVSTITL